MIEPASLSNNAHLALASYANLIAGDTLVPANRATLLEAAGAGMSPAQLAQFAARYPSVVVQFNDTPAEGGMNTGLSVTVFKDSAENLTVAFRGTDKLAPGSQSDLPAAPISLA